MHNFLAEVTADCTDVLVAKPQKVMPNPGRKNQIVHTFEDGRNAVVAVSNTSIFEVELQWTYVSEEDRSTIFELFHASAKANGSARSFYWKSPVDGYVYTVRFLTPLRTVYKPGSLRSVETIRLRVDGRFGDHEYIIDLGDLHLATVDNGAMFFHDTEDFSVYVGASGDTPFRIVFTDSDGLTAEAWCGEVGGGLTLGVNDAPTATCTDPDNDTDTTTGWTASPGSNPATLASVDGGRTGKALQITETNSSAAGASHTVGEVGQKELWVFSGYVKAGTEATYRRQLFNITAGYASFLSETGESSGSDWSTHFNNYRTIPTGCNSILMGVEFLTTAGSGKTILYDDISFKQVTDIPATGLKLYSTKNGTTKGMGTTDAGFNPNAITKVDIYG